MSCKINSNREYIHSYCLPCKRFFNSFFSLSSIKLQQTSAGKKPAPPPNYNKPNHQTQHHHQTSQPSTKKYPKINKNPKINPTQNQQKPQIYPIATTQHSANHTDPPETHRKNPYEKSNKNPHEKPTGKPVGFALICH